MTIRREDLDAGRVDLSEVADRGGTRLNPVHPGDVLRHDYLEPVGMSVYRLAELLRVPRSRMNEIVQGHRSVTAETALRLEGVDIHLVQMNALTRQRIERKALGV